MIESLLTLMATIFYTAVTVVMLVVLYVVTAYTIRFLMHRVYGDNPGIGSRIAMLTNILFHLGVYMLILFAGILVLVVLGGV
jgi:hypothetical protein